MVKKEKNPSMIPEESDYRSQAWIAFVCLNSKENRLAQELNLVICQNTGIG